MHKNFIRKQLLAGIFCMTIFAGSAQPVCAAQFEGNLSPALFQRMLCLAGLSATTQPGPDDDFPTLVTVEGIGAGSFSLGFPAGGLQPAAPFYLACDDAAALVQFSVDGELTVLEGDERVTASGLISVIACILATIASMISGIIWAVLHLNIMAILEAVFNAVATLLACIFQLFA